MAPLLKDLYNEEYIELLCKNISLEYSSFQQTSFKVAIFNVDFKDYELKERMRHISTTLGEFLPKEYAKAIDILKLIFTNFNHKYGLE
ncbi:MAG TPA: DNA alkylation repair protein, partial [Sulfurimonas sp.]|nr:DNA alkylation repair protein [Sulfurimonas sp.]